MEEADIKKLLIEKKIIDPDKIEYGELRSNFEKTDELLEDFKRKARRISKI